MNTYTDAGLLDSAGAIESLELLKNVTTSVTTSPVKTCHKESLSDNSAEGEGVDEESGIQSKNPAKHKEIAGFD